MASPPLTQDRQRNIAGYEEAGGRVARQLGYGIESVRSGVRQADSIHLTYQAVAVAAAASPCRRHSTT